MKPPPTFVPLAPFEYVDQAEMLARAERFSASLQRRRSARMFSDRPVAREVIEHCLAAAASAPSGANLQPWHFVAVSNRAPLGTDSEKPFLELAPWLIAVFVQKWRRLADGRKVKHYYPNESVGIATGLLLAAIHQCGLAALTHTPSPMGFLNEILGRPADRERPFLLMVVGYPSENCVVPDIRRKPIADVASFIE
jgi:iodotyrosine deiodinase